MTAFLNSSLALKYWLFKSALRVGKLILTVYRQLQCGERRRSASLSGLQPNDRIQPLPVGQGKVSLLGVTAAAQNTAYKAEFSRQGGGARQQDASLQSLTIVGVWQEQPIYFHRFTSVLLSVHTVACTALRADLWHSWVWIRHMVQLAVGSSAVGMLMLPHPLVPQVKDMPPERHGGYINIIITNAEHVCAQRICIGSGINSPRM